MSAAGEIQLSAGHLLSGQRSGHVDGFAAVVVAGSCSDPRRGVMSAAGEIQLSAGHLVSGSAAQRHADGFAAVVVAELNAAPVLQPAVAPLHERGGAGSSSAPLAVSR
jgi:hypothetical protein